MSTMYMENLTMYLSGIKVLRYMEKSNNVSEWDKRSKISEKLTMYQNGIKGLRFRKN